MADLLTCILTYGLTYLLTYLPTYLPANLLANLPTYFTQARLMAEQVKAANAASKVEAGGAMRTEQLAEGAGAARSQLRRAESQVRHRVQGAGRGRPGASCGVPRAR